MPTTAGASSNIIFDATPVIVFLIVAIAAILGTWRIFEKMGEPGWKCVIPFYNEYVVFRALWSAKAFWTVIATSIVAGICGGIAQIAFEVDLNAASAVMNVISLALLIVSLVFQVRLCRRLTKAFGKGVGMTIALIILPFIATLILGFGQAQYHTPAK